MIPLPKFKELLEPDTTDQEAEEVRQALYALAEIAFDFWQQEKTGQLLSIR